MLALNFLLTGKQPAVWKNFGSFCRKNKKIPANISPKKRKYVCRVIVSCFSGYFMFFCYRRRQKSRKVGAQGRLEGIKNLLNPLTAGARTQKFFQLRTRMQRGYRAFFLHRKRALRVAEKHAFMQTFSFRQRLRKRSVKTVAGGNGVDGFYLTPISESHSIPCSAATFQHSPSCSSHSYSGGVRPLRRCRY